MRTLIFLLLAGCPHPVPLDYSSTPQLPAPSSGAYARVHQPPRDPIVRDLAGDVGWDTSLEGAAAGLALAAAEGQGGLQRFEVREALWRAGYAYPALEVRGWSVAQGSAPPDDVGVWLQAQPEMDHGLVRARSSQGDAWVGLIASPRVDLGTLPRTVITGGSFSLPAVPGASFRVSDPSGALHHGSLEAGAEVVLALPGEWLFELRDAEGLLALFPVYSGVAPPDLPLLDAPEEPPADAQALQAHATRQVQAIRSAYSLPAWTDNPLLVERALGALDRSGDEEGVRTLRCVARSVEDCLDNMAFDLDARVTLLDARPAELGVAARANLDGVQAVVLVVPR